MVSSHLSKTPLLPEDIRKELEEIEGKIIDGEIEVRTAFQMSTEEVVSLRDEMKP